MIYREKKRKLSQMSHIGNSTNHNPNILRNDEIFNSMVSNVRIEDRNSKRCNQPPLKRARINHPNTNNNNNNNTINLLNNNNGGLLPLVNQNGNTLPLFQSSGISNMSGPALSLLSEALKKMPALQPAIPSKGNNGLNDL